MYIEPTRDEIETMKSACIDLNFPSYFTAIDMLASIDADSVDAEDRDTWKWYQDELHGIIGAYRRWMQLPKKGRHQFMVRCWK